MLLLHGSQPLDSAQSLQQSLLAGLGEFFHLPRSYEHIRVDGDPPTLRSIHIDLSLVRADLTRNPPLPGDIKNRKETFQLARLAFRADPIYLAEEAAFHLQLDAESLAMAVLQDSHGQRWMGLLRAGKGQAVVDVGAGEMEKLLLGGVRQAMTRHKIHVEHGAVHLTQEGPATLRLHLQIRARKAFLKGTVEVTGLLRVDPHLTLHPTQLSCSGKGALGKIAMPFVQPQLARWEAKAFPLLGHAFGEIECPQPQLTLGSGNAIHLEAAFGSPARPSD